MPVRAASRPLRPSKKTSRPCCKFRGVHLIKPKEDRADDKVASLVSAALDRRGNGPLFHRARRQQASVRLRPLLARPNKTGGPQGRPQPSRPPLVVKVGDRRSYWMPLAEREQ